MKQWNEILARLRREFRPEQFNLWIRTLQCKRLDDKEIELAVPSDYYKNWIQIHSEFRNAARSPPSGGFQQLVLPSLPYSFAIAVENGKKMSSTGSCGLLFRS